MIALSGAADFGAASEASSVDPFRGTLVGKRTVTLTLRRGHWPYRAFVGRIHAFTVVA